MNNNDITNLMNMLNKMPPQQLNNMATQLSKNLSNEDRQKLIQVLNSLKK